VNGEGEVRLEETLGIEFESAFAVRYQKFYSIFTNPCC
jgi:hypothetical protein